MNGKLRQLVRELTQDGREPIEVLVAIMRGELKRPDGFFVDVEPKERRAAAVELLDRAYGKAIQPVVNEDELDALIEAELKRVKE